MRIDPELARLAVSRRAAPIALTCLLALAGFACPVEAAGTAASPGHAVVATASLTSAPRYGGAGTFGSGATVALEEQSLPPEDLPSPTASPAASPAPSFAQPSGSQSPSGAQGDGSGNGAQAPAPPATTSAPAAQASPASDDEGAREWTRMPATAGSSSGSSGVPDAGGAGAATGTPDAAGAATGAPDAAAGAPVADEPAPEATPTDAPPPYDVGSVQPTAPVSDQPLTGLIAGTKDQPALNASLRFAEDGRKALEASKPDDAIRDLGRAISIDPTDPYAYFYLGRAYMLKKDYPQALAFFGRSEVGVRTVPAWLGEVKSFEGACLEEQGKFPQAAAAYRQALDVAPGNLMARTGYGRLSESLSDANAGSAEPPPPPLDGAALPAPQVDLAAPAPAEAAPPPAQSDQTDQSDTGADSGADTGDDSGTDSTGSAASRSNGAGAQGNQ